MQTQHHKNINSSGNEGHKVHVCHKCGWPFPNPHPSAKHRRSHKKHCGTIEGYKLGASGENKTDLDVSDDDTKTPSNGLKAVEKVPEMLISRKSSSGAGSRSSRSTRSEEDVFSDAVADFSDVPVVVDTIVLRESADVKPDLSKDVEVTQLDVDNADPGDLYPPNSDTGTQLQNVDISRPENEEFETDMPSQPLFSSAVDSISNSSLSVGEGSVNESTLPCSKTGNALDSEEQGNLEVALDIKLEDAVNMTAENADKTSETILLPQKVNEDNLEFVPASASMEALWKQGDEFSNKDKFDGEINCSGKETREVDESQDITNILTNFADKTSEAVSVPQMENGDNMELLPANAAMQVIGRQHDGFDDKNNCLTNADIVEQINSIDAGSNVEVGSCLETFKDHGSFINSIQDLVVPDALPLKEHSESVLEDYEDHKNEKLPDTLDLAQEVEHVENDNDVNKEALSNTLLIEPSKSTNSNSKDVIFKTLQQEADSAREASVENKLGSTETQAVDADMCESSSVVVHLDNGVGQGEAVTYSQEQNFLVSFDTTFPSALDVSGNLANSIEVVKPVRDDSEYGRKDVQIFDVLEADTTKAEKKKLPLTKDSVDCDVKTIEVEDKLFESTLTVAQSDDRKDDKVKVQKDEHESEAVMSGCSNAEVKELGSFSNQMVGDECVNILGTTLISDVSNAGNMTEQTRDEEISVHKASDSVDASFFNNVMNNDTHRDENEIFEDAKEKKFGEGKVDLGLFSDKDDSADVTQNKLERVEVGVHAEKVADMDDRSTKEKDGNGSNLADGDENLTKQQESVPELDVQVDSISQTDSLDGNWGSVSVLSGFSDAPAANENGSLPSQSTVKAEKVSLDPKPDSGESDILKPPYIMTSLEYKGNGSGLKDDASEAKTSEEPQEKTGWVQSMTSETNEASSSKKNEEIIAKVTNWSTATTGKQHMPLKSFLGESSPNVKDNPSLGTQAAGKTIVNGKEPADEASRGEIKKEWSSPARYPTNIKREKGKGKSRPYWASFMCCSSVQTS